MSNLEQKIKIETDTEEHFYVDYTPIESLIDDLQKSKEIAISKGFDELTIRFVKGACYCSYDCHCTPDVRLYGKRIETDEEYNKRVNTQRERQQAIEDAEKAQLVRLMKKYKP